MPEFGEWKNLDMDNLPVRLDRKWLNRKIIMTMHWNMLNSHLPEYCVPFEWCQRLQNYKVLDVCCGSGSMLEILRHFGHGIFGLDVSEFYFPLLISQDIPYAKHNCITFPYPADESDLVLCFGAFTFFPLDKWIPVLDELARLSRKTIFIGINRGPELEQMRDTVTAWSNPKFKLVFHKDYVWKWEAV